MPPSKSNKSEALTLGDRLVTALLGGICAFVTMLVVWFVVIYVGGRTGNDVSLPFYWTWVVGLAVAGLAALAGPERTMDVFEKVWGFFGFFFFGRRADSDLRTPRSRPR